MTLFLSAPGEYDGGELVVGDTYGTHAVKLPAGDLVVYPAASLHRVQPVTRGTRLASFFWGESMVRERTAGGSCTTSTCRSWRCARARASRPKRCD